jgi:hypothetical protein
MYIRDFVKDINVEFDKLRVNLFNPRYFKDVKVLGGIVESIVV